MSSVGQLVPQVTRSPPNMNVKFNGPHVEGSYCTSIDYNYDPVISVLCAMYIAFGIVYTLFGYRCFKASMFLTGFTFGSAIVYLICLQEYLMPPYGNVGVALCAGLLFGLITMLIQYVGLFMTGFHTGVLLAIAGLAIYDHFLEVRPTTYCLCAIVLLCSGIFFAVINLYWKKVVGACETGAGGATTMPIVVADAGCLASCGHRWPHRAMRSDRHRNLPRAEYKRTEASHESPTDTTDHPRATNRDETTQIQIPVPGPHRTRGCNFTVVRTSTTEEGSMRQLEWRMQYSSERLDPPYRTSWLRGRPTYRQRR